jgi:hypothetical protein
MTAASVRLYDLAAVPQPSIACYSILSQSVVVVSDVHEALLRVEESYAAFRIDSAPPDDAIVLRLQELPGGSGYLVSGPSGGRPWPAYEEALLDLFDRLVHALLARLLAGGVYAIHAGAVVYRGAALVLAGPSGHGKTTLTLGLLRRGLGLLSDEFAIVEPATRQVLPYRRSLHVRPGTLDLIPELRFLHGRSCYRLGGGNEWAITPQDVELALPGSLAPAAPLGYVLLLEGAPRAEANPAITPLRPALAALELLRSVWAASVDFAGALKSISPILDQIPCARLQVGAFEPTLDSIESWLEAGCG